MSKNANVKKAMKLNGKDVAVKKVALGKKIISAKPLKPMKKAVSEKKVIPVKPLIIPPPQMQIKAIVPNVNPDVQVKQIMDAILSAWTGHFTFAQWACNTLNPKTIVELGVDFGFSTFSFALTGKGKVYGVDWFKGDEFTGYRNTYEFVSGTYKNLKKLKPNMSDIELIAGDFADIAKNWNSPQRPTIDILHIDGNHKYEDIKADYNNWYGKVREGGLILIHDIAVKSFGVNKFFNELSNEKYYFTHSAGLGVVIKGSNPQLSTSLLNYPNLKKGNLAL